MSQPTADVEHVRVSSFTCLPSIGIQGDINLGSSRIQMLGFDHWLTLEGQRRSAQYDKLESKYVRSPPAFWRKDFDVPPDLIIEPAAEKTRALTRYIERDLDRVVLAIHWYAGTAPISPMRSVTYFDPRGEATFARFPELAATVEDGGVPRRYGESEKEFATQNPAPIIVFGEGDQSPLASMLSFVEQTEVVWASEAYEMALQSLELSSAPGVDWPMRLVLLVGAYEALLLPDRTKDLQDTFANRLACMVASEYRHIPKWAKQFGLAYDIRSDVVHGRMLSSIAKLAVPLEHFVRALHRAGITALCRLIAYHLAHPIADDSKDPLWRALDAGTARRRSFDAVNELLSSHATQTVTHQWTSVPVI